MAYQPPQSVAAGPPYLRLRFECLGQAGSADERALDGPIVRRVLGRALIERFCPFGRPLCEEPEGPETPVERCDLARCCPYGVLFAGSLTARPPFALFVPLRAVGPSTPVELTLFGPGVNVFAWAVEAVVRALAAGIGARRRPYRVSRVIRVGPDGSTATLGEGPNPLPPRIEADRLVPTSERVDAEAPALVEFLSPARLKAEGRLLKGPGAPPFAVLVARVLDRYRDLFGQDVGDVVRPALRGTTLALARRVEVLVDEVEWIEVEDYSARQGQELRLGGKAGRVLYGPGAGAFLPILRLGEVLHVGKNAASGCGRMAVPLAPGSR